MTEQIFYAEDTCALADDPLSIGTVDRTPSDVETHEPDPQQDYDNAIERHSDVSSILFASFLRSGIPPAGTVLVSWQTAFKTELIPESRLVLLDRSLLVGDVVKRDIRSAMSGTVINVEKRCKLAQPTSFVPLAESAPLLKDVPSAELKSTYEYNEGSLILYGGWVGRIDETFDEVAVLLSDGSLVVIEDSEELTANDPLVDRLNVGDVVTTKKGVLRRGRWKFGAYQPNIAPVGVVVHVRTTSISVHWLCRGIFPQVEHSMPGAYPDPDEPPDALDLDVLESGRVHVYDLDRRPSNASQRSGPPQTRTISSALIDVGHRVRFKDLSGACVKYNITRIPRTRTRGYDTNVFIVAETKSEITVLWQDQTITRGLSTSFVPDSNVTDEDEVWPGEIVCSKERKARNLGESDVYEPARVGVVQSVKSADRIVHLRWFLDASVSFHGDDLLPDSRTGTALGPVEEVSLYDIFTTTALNRRRGDFVTIRQLPAEYDDVFRQRGGISWFGEVVDLGFDGQLVVRLGALEGELLDVKIPPEYAQLAYSSDMDEVFHGDHYSESSELLDDVDDEDMDDDSDGSEEVEPTYEYEYQGYGGERVDQDTDDEAWSTDDSDADMPDLDGGVDTANTTPPTGERTTPDSIPPEPDAPPSVKTAAPEVTGTENTGATTNNPSSPDTLTLDFAGFPNAPASFLILDTPPPSDHHYLSEPTPSSSASNQQRTRRIRKEHKILSTSLPPGIYVRTFESRLDLLRILILGPLDTPYALAPFLIDMHLGPSFPSAPPSAYFHSWTHGQGPVNPNLYEDGKICLSLLGTWHADEKGEAWSASKSTVLQVLVSLLGLVLVREPYFNEAGYSSRQGTAESVVPSRLYTERALFRTRGFIEHALRNPPQGFVDEVRWLYVNANGPRLLQKALQHVRRVIAASEAVGDGEVADGLSRVSKGAVVMLKRQLAMLEAL
ncbi:hypothetical protein H2201_007703 [Coniosporium apollinis]|uniref:UBC core domain-containing protein n=1 Tax=Coniosporium apollinis TaxID=61459 RepID=A0ABQ9NIQ6_9PEZI|nr:hypothetical protein H2201_007703 [Coniosporium apollinis]